MQAKLKTITFTVTYATKDQDFIYNKFVKLNC